MSKLYYMTFENTYLVQLSDEQAEALEGGDYDSMDDFLNECEYKTYHDGRSEYELAREV